jgi:hypothetical protein
MRQSLGERGSALFDACRRHDGIDTSADSPFNGKLQALTSFFYVLAVFDSSL